MIHCTPEPLTVVSVVRLPHAWFMFTRKIVTLMDTLHWLAWKWFMLQMINHIPCKRTNVSHLNVAEDFMLPKDLYIH